MDQQSCEDAGQYAGGEEGLAVGAFGVGFEGGHDGAVGRVVLVLLGRGEFFGGWAGVPAVRLSGAGAVRDGRRPEYR